MSEFGGISDIEMGLAIGYRRDLQQLSRNAQIIIDQVGAERDAALAEVRRLRIALAKSEGELKVARLMSRRAQLHC